MTLSVVLNSCQSTATTTTLDSDLVEANAALAMMTQDRILSRSCFRVAYPEGGSENFVRYLFSDLGSAEWPVAFDEVEAEQMKAAGQKPLPPNVVISANARVYSDRKELVIQSQNGQISVKGYLPHTTDPQFEAVWELGQSQTQSEFVPLCESNIDMGMGIDIEENTP